MSTVFGALIIFFRIPDYQVNRFISFCLSLSLSIMIGLSVTELVPKSTFQILFSYPSWKGIVLCLVAFLLGIGLIFFMNWILNKQKKQSLYQLGILSMVALMLHNLPEGIATFMSAYQDVHFGFKLSIAIMLHNIPEGISIAVPIYYATKRKKDAILATFLSGVAEPIGALLTAFLFAPLIRDVMIYTVLLFVGGIMITLSIQKLFPEAKKYHERPAMMIGMGVGLLLTICNFCFF